MSEPLPPSAPPVRHPISLVDTDQLRRSRLTVFFRLLLAIPHFIWWYLWGIASFLAAFVAWVIGIFTGRVPDGLHNFLAAYTRYTAHVYSYLWIAADPYPGFMGQPGYPMDLVIAPPESQSRLTIGFRLILAIPAVIVAYVLQQVASLLAIVAWFVALFTAKLPRGLEDILAYCVRYQAQAHGYVFLLTQRYPSFADE